MVAVSITKSEDVLILHEQMVAPLWRGFPARLWVDAVPPHSPKSDRDLCRCVEHTVRLYPIVLRRVLWRGKPGAPLAATGNLRALALGRSTHTSLYYCTYLPFIEKARDFAPIGPNGRQKPASGPLGFSCVRDVVVGKE